MKTCLIVDDSNVVRRVARRILERNGLAVTEAENGEAALAACRQSLPDAILLDWNMPVMNGIEFLTRLRAAYAGEHGADRPIVVFCTTETEVDKIEAAMDAGAQEYIMKPFDEAILVGKLQQVNVLKA